MPSSPAAALFLAISHFLHPHHPATSKDSRPVNSRKLSKSKDGKHDSKYKIFATASTPPPLHVKGIQIIAPKLVTVHTNGTIVPATEGQASTISPLKLPQGAPLAGDVSDLFGTGLPGRVVKLVGSGSSSGVREVVELTREVSLDQLLRGVSGTKFGDLKLGNAQFKYRPEPVGSQPAGLYLTADTPLSGPLQPVADAMKCVFGMSQPRIDLTGYMGKERDWKKVLKPKSLALTALLEGKAERGGVTFTEIGLEVKAERKQLKRNSLNSNALNTIKGSLKGAYDFEVKFHGKVAVTVPGTVAPLLLQYTLKEEKLGVWTLRLTKADDWTDVVGFKGLKLSNIQLVANFPVGKSVEKFSFDMEAIMAFGKSQLALTGAYSKDNFYVQASLPECHLDNIRHLYTSTTNRQLEPFHHPTVLKDMIVRIDGKGLSFSGHVEVNGHQATQATFNVKRDGIFLTGALEDVNLGHVTVKEAALNVFIGRAVKNTTSRESGFSITGSVTFRKTEVDVVVDMTYSKIEGLKYTVYGEIQSDDIRLNALAPEVKGKWLDVEISKVAFIASNTDAPNIKQNVFAYPVRQGVQFCATIEKIQQVDHVVRQDVRGLVLQALWDGRSFSFGILLPAPVGISLGKKITSGPVELSINIAKLELMFSCGLNVKPHRQEQPLVFTFGLTGSLTQAKGFGQMTNYWVNPFGINENIKLGPNMAVQIGFDYAVVAATGAPSSAGFSGGMAIGDAEAQVAMEISANPTDELIKASLTELSTTNLVKFASQITGVGIPLPPEEIMAFRDILFYICSGVSIGTKTYAAGVTMKGEIELLGHKTDLEASVGSSIIIKSQFDKLQLGPLCICGVDGQRASSEVELGISKQHILVDGAVKLGGVLETSINGVLDILPKPNMKFALKYDFADALDLELEAAVVGMVDWSNMHGADFTLHAVLEQDILEYVVKQIKTFITAALHFLQKGIEAAHKIVDAAHDEIHDAITAAAAALEEAKEKWEEKEAAVKTALQEVTEDFENGVQALQDTLHEATEDFENWIWNKHQKVEAAKLECAMQEKEQFTTVYTVRRDTDFAIRSQLEEIREVKHQMKTGFGDARKNVLDATEGVAKAQAAYDECAHVVTTAEKALAAAYFYRKVDLKLYLDHKRCDLTHAAAALTTAQHVLDHARAVAGTDEYKGLQKAKEEKKAALLQNRETLQTSVAAEEQHLVADRAGSEAVIAVKKQKIEQLRTVVDDDSLPTTKPRIARVRDTRRELNQFREAKTPQLEEARAAHEKLTETEEYANLLAAKKQLRKAKSRAVEKDVAKDVVATLDTDITAASVDGKKKAEHASLLEKLENLIDVERIELTGSVRGLVEHGRPLDAKVRGKLFGKEFDSELAYGLGDTKTFLKGLWGVVWEGVKGQVEAEMED